MGSEDIPGACREPAGSLQVDGGVYGGGVEMTGAALQGNSAVTCRGRFDGLGLF